ncbi:MAG: diadenylate cyclase CdaA [Abditibacteriales bacterium]|nr:diadenylate cyclase CdaA [Abditibacteriales bacterium]MDW8368020.1 diadenylate cyclase CdaA [Abditibacteriales bacterium]
MWAWLQTLIQATGRFNALSIFLAIVDILIVAVVLYYLLTWAKNTRAWQLMKGLLVILVLKQCASMLDLYALDRLLTYLIGAGVVALVVIFQPEMRLALDQLGRGQIVWGSLPMSPQRRVARVVNEIGKAVEDLSNRSMGALIVVEREVKLDAIKETGQRVDGELSADLLLTILHRGSPLHDGAVVISEDKISAAGCILPLSDNQDLPHSMGTRHRAALGLTEVADALVVVVSEETGRISLVHDGEMDTPLHPQLLKERLLSLLQSNGRPAALRRFRWRNKQTA